MGALGLWEAEFWQAQERKTPEIKAMASRFFFIYNSRKTSCRTNGTRLRRYRRLIGYAKKKQAKQGDKSLTWTEKEGSISAPLKEPGFPGPFYLLFKTRSRSC